jgi:hypothetical protein
LRQKSLAKDSQVEYRIAVDEQEDHMQNQRGRLIGEPEPGQE